MFTARQHSWSLVSSGKALFQSGDFKNAEADFREALTLAPINANAYAGLAQALNAQGRVTEALQAYQSLFQYPLNLSSAAQDRRTQMGYAALLSQIGRWDEAVSIYEKNLPDAEYGDAPRLDIHFDPQLPMPTELQAMAHVASGIECTGHGEKADAFIEFSKAASLAPTSAFANYYYGYGWQQLSPAERAKFGSEPQAKAALQKAVKVGKGAVKKAAQKALRVAMKTK